MNTVGLTEPADLGTILGVWAHPDDEAYLMAGTAMLALAHGSTVACVTATAGEAGETADEATWPQRCLAEIRRGEMAASLAIIGIADHELWHLPDGDLADLDGDRGPGLVLRALERLQPDTILTFGADGMTGHPDHVAVGDWAVAAVRQSGRATRVLAATKEPAWYDEFPDITEMVFPIGGPETAPIDITLRVDLPDNVVDRKLDALRAQASQTTGLLQLMGVAAYRQWLRTEYWVER
jgi:LmbE family N-acetylglucosaminyl deacetylase